MKSISFTVLSALLLTFLACDAPEDDREPLPFEPAGPDAAPIPSALGPYPVGVRTLEFVDESRVTPGRTEPRKLVVEVWYPAVEATRDQPPHSYGLYDEVSQGVRELYPDIDPEDLGVVSTTAVKDAVQRDDGDTYPLVVFSHGKGGVRQQSTYYTATLASHGYVVISPDHEGDTINDLLLEGDVDINTTVDSFVDRPLDVAFLITQMEQLPESEPLKAIMDVETIGVTGHSFGALTSFRIAGLDSRVDAIVAQTPVSLTLVEIDLGIRVEDFGIPYMIQAAGLDDTLPAETHSDPLFDAMVPPRFYLTLETAGHFTYSDLCVLDIVAIDEALGDDVNISNVLGDGCGTQNIPTADAFPVINHYSIGFFNTYLRGSEGSLKYLTQEDGRAIVPGNEITFVGEPG